MPVAPRATPSTVPEPYAVPPSQEFDGNDGSWSTFKISVGTPGQDFRVLPSTQAGETYVVLPEGCVEGDGENCPNQRGAEIFNNAQSPGFQVNESSTWSALGSYKVQMESRLNITANGLFGYDKVALGTGADSSSLSLAGQVVAGIGELPYWMGFLPLGIPDSSFSSQSQSIDSFIHQLRNATKIPSLSFGYTAGAKYRLKSVFGSLILGGYDSTRFKPNPNPFSFTFSTDPSRLLTVGVESIMATNTLKDTQSLSSSAHFSVIDSTVPHLWLPREICDQFEEAFGLTYDENTDLYTVNETSHKALKSKNPQITIKLVNSMEDTSTNYTNIVLPYAAFDLQASYPWYPNPTNYFPIRRAAYDTQYVLGRTLLQEAYLMVDYERANFTIAQAVFPDPLPAAKLVTIEPPSNTTSSSDSGSSLSTAAIGGIGAGGAILLILLIGAAVFFRRRRKTSQKKYELANTQVSESGSHANLAIAQHKQQHLYPQELSGTPLTELDSPRHPSDQKAFLSPKTTPQELDTPRHPSYQKPFLSPTNLPQELDTPRHSSGQKPFLSPTNLPQELDTPNHPRWQEVTAANYFEMDGESVPSRANSRAPSDDGKPEQTQTLGVSPMTQTPRFQQHYHS